jgi:hypothetical protein
MNNQYLQNSIHLRAAYNFMIHGFSIVADLRNIAVECIALMLYNLEALG